MSSARRRVERERRQKGMRSEEKRNQENKKKNRKNKKERKEKRKTNKNEMYSVCTRKTALLMYGLCTVLVMYNLNTI